MVIWFYVSFPVGRIVGRTEKQIAGGSTCWCCLPFFIRSKTDLFPFDLFQPSVYELVRQPNFASLSIIVEDFVKDSGATFSGMSLSCCPGLHVLWLCFENEYLCFK